MMLTRGRVGVAALLVAAIALSAGLWLLVRRTAPVDSERQAAAGDRFRRGFDLYRQGLYRNAQAELLRAKQEGLRSADLEFGLAQIEVALASEERSTETRRGSRARVQAATEQHLRDALRLDANHTPSLLMLAQICDSAFPYRHVEAIQLMERALAVDPDNQRLRLRLASLYQTRPLELPVLFGEKRDPLQPLDSSIQLNMARAHLDRVIQMSPPLSEDAAAGQRDLSWVLIKMADYETAIAHAEIGQRAYAALPGHEEDERRCFFQAGLAAYRRGDAKRALGYLRKALHGEDTPWPVRWIMHLAAQRAGGYPVGVPESLRIRFRPELRADAAGSKPFSDVAPEMGVAKQAGAAATAWGDLDGSGYDSLFVEGCNTFCNLFRYDGQRFNDVTEKSGLGNADWGFGAGFYDFDNDGAEDLYVARYGWAGRGRHSLYKNDGHGRFSDVTERAGVANLEGSTYVSLAADFDRDGYLDIFNCNGVTGDGSSNTLFHNNGNGTFSDWTRRAGLAETRFLGNGTIGAAIGDYDNDGWPDLFLVGANAPNRLFRNRGDGTFVDVTSRAGVGGPGTVMGYMGFMADFNGDGRLDLLVAPLAPWPIVIRGMQQGVQLTPEEQSWSPQLYLNNGDGTFRHMQNRCGMLPVGCMGAQIGDLDNDGNLDVIFGTGDPNPERLEPTRVYRNLGDGHFEDVSWRWGLTGGGKGHGITVADFDHDGQLDIYAPYGGYFHCDVTPAMLFRNQLPHRPSIWLRLIGAKSNRDAIGARLTLSAGSRTLVREVTGPTGFGSTNSQWVQFGLGDARRIDGLSIRWPSGLFERVAGLEPETRVEVTEGRGVTRRMPLKRR
jgi:tetratricopeptide (TPR) repeat protein